MPRNPSSTPSAQVLGHLHILGIAALAPGSRVVQLEFYESLERDGTGQWWKIVSPQSQDALGAIGYNHYQAQHRKAELGYWLLPRFWKQGVLTEVMPVLLRYLLREKGLHRIEALVEEGNTASNRLLERIGFLYEGTMRDCEIKNGRFISLRIYSLLRGPEE